jgi:hypothetical protein
MKRVTLLVILLGLSGCATQPPSAQQEPGGLLVQAEFYVPSPAELLYGTWVNPELRLPLFYPKLVIHSWGLVEYFGSVDDDLYDWRGASIIVSKWVDESGATWYREFSRCSIKGFYAGHAFNLFRVSGQGTVLEFIYGNLGWPEPRDLDPATNPTYVKYRRLE